MQRMSKWFANYCDAESQVRNLAEAGIADRWIARESGGWRVVWYV